MTSNQKSGIAIAAIIVLAVVGFVLFSGSNSQQDEVLSDLAAVVEENATADSADGADSALEEGTENDGAPENSTETTTSTADPSEQTGEADPGATATETADTDTAPETATTDATSAEAADTQTTEAQTTDTQTTGPDSSAPETTVQTTAAPETTATTTAPTTAAPETTTEAPASDRPSVATFEIVETIPHDTNAFTQGLEISNGRLFESTGLVGRSSIRELDLETGEIIRNTAVPNVFGEGLTIVGDTAIQITWQDEIAFRYDLDTFDVIETYNYDGQGWGLCLASGGSGNLIMSDGSSQLDFRDPDSFELLGSVDVRLDGAPIENLNELECIGNTVWANIWLSSLIIEIDPATGQVLTVLDADSLRPASTNGDSGAVWNGLAYDATDGTLLVTGKLWPTIFRLRLS